MSNTDAAYGFKPVRMLGGRPYNGAVVKRPIAYNYATALYRGDPVKLVSGKVNRAAITDAISGVIVGFELPAVSTYGTLPGYWPAGGFATLGNQDCYALCVEDPDVVYEAQFGSSTAPTIANVGSYAKCIAIPAGNTATGISKQAVDASTLNTAVSGLVWKFLSFVDTADNDATAAYSRGYFIAASHVWAARVAAS